MIYQIFTQPYWARNDDEKTSRLVIIFDMDGKIIDVVETSRPDHESKVLIKLRHHNALQITGFHLMPNSYEAIKKGFQNRNNPPVMKVEG